MIFSTFKEMLINPHTPVAQKVAHEVVFQRSQNEGVQFFLNGPHCPLSPQIFDARVKGKTDRACEG